MRSFTPWLPLFAVISAVSALAAPATRPPSYGSTVPPDPASEALTPLPYLEADRAATLFSPTPTSGFPANPGVPPPRTAWGPRANASPSPFPTPLNTIRR